VRASDGGFRPGRARPIRCRTQPAPRIAVRSRSPQRKPKTLVEYDQWHPDFGISASTSYHIKTSLSHRARELTDWGGSGTDFWVPRVVLDQCSAEPMHETCFGASSPLRSLSMNGHSKTVKRFHEPGDCHELTFSCFRRMPLLTSDDWRRLLAESLDLAVQGQSSRLIAYVFMPEHVHILIQPTTHEVRIDLFLKTMKAPFSRRIKKRLEETDDPLLATLSIRERPGVHCFRFWQEGGGYDRNLRSETSVQAAIDYIHGNPVRRQLCERPADWRWSSARHYQDDSQRATGPETPPTIHGLDWDFIR
jgi:putative transposase